MRRRRLLAALAGGTLPLTAGCAGVLEESAGSDRDTYEVPPRTRTTTTEERQLERVSVENPFGVVREPIGDGGDGDRQGPGVIDLETGPRTCALVDTGGTTLDDVFVGVGFENTATADHPAEVLVVVENEGDREVELRTLNVPMLADTRGDLRRFGSDARAERGLVPNPELLLVPVGENAPDRMPPFERSEGYWRVAEPYPELSATSIEAGPRERLLIRLALVGSVDTTGRPIGTYVFGLWAYGFQVTVWNTDRPGPPVDSRFGPDQGTRSDSVHWFHEADAETVTYLRPSTERVEVPGVLEFRIVNHSRRRLSFGEWALWKQYRDRWYQVTISEGDDDPIEPGDFLGRTLRLDDESGAGNESVTLLGEGRYAATVASVHALGPVGALFDVVGDSLSVVPTDGVETTRDGVTVHVESPAVRDGEGETASVRAERIDDPPDGARRYVPEQLYREANRGLRNLLAPFEDGVEAVVLRTRPQFAPRPGPLVLEDEGFEVAPVSADGEALV